MSGNFLFLFSEALSKASQFPILGGSKGGWSPPSALPFCGGFYWGELRKSSPLFPYPCADWGLYLI